MGILSKIKSIFRKKPVFGIAFGSGGAKGMAHLGALKAFEEAGISFDVVSGASIGSIVGALYAKGFTSADMVQVIESLNRKEFTKNLRPLADLSFAEEFLSQYLEGDISSLGKPFAAWVTDGETNEGRMITSGNIAHVLTASSAIPPFFRAVELDGRRCFDGAFSNAIPSEACRALGADFVLGIDLSAFRKPDDERGRVSRIFDAAVSKFTPVRYNPDSKTRGYDHADFMLTPNLADYRATDVSREGMDRMFELGYETAVENMDKIKDSMKHFRKKKGAKE